MPKKKRHSNAEITAKLAQAENLAKEGKLQSEIAHTLGVSVMTLHRWRKAPSSVTAAPMVPASRSHSEDDEAERIAELQLENSRLRRLVTDLLLEKVKLEETAQTSRPSSRRATR
jgi:transposase